MNRYEEGGAAHAAERPPIEYRPAPSTTGRLTTCGYGHRVSTLATFGVPIRAGGMILSCAHHLPAAASAQAGSAPGGLAHHSATVYVSPLGYWLPAEEAERRGE